MIALEFVETSMENLEFNALVEWMRLLYGVEDEGIST